jgi:large subunit ribosomal protein L10
VPVTRERKQELVQAYREWLEASSGVVLTSYSGMSVRALEDLRRKVREAGGEYHVIKNRLMALAMRQAGMEVPSQALEGTTAIGFAGEDVTAVVKAIVETARQAEAFKVKAALLEGRIYEAKQVERLAELPPLPVMRAQLLGLLQVPATRVAGVVAGSVRQIVNVVKAYSETQPAGA